MKNIVLSLLFLIFGSIKIHSQFPVKRIVIENSELKSSKIEYGRIILNDPVTVEKYDYVPQQYIVLKNKGIKNDDNKWLFFDNVDSYKSIFFITVTNNNRSMQFLFAFNRYDERGPNHIFLEKTSFAEGTYYFDFSDREIMSSPNGHLDDRFGDFYIDKYKKFRISKKGMSEEEIKKIIAEPKLKQQKIIKKIL